MEFAPKEWWASTVEFWRETKSEMKKVAWPARAEVISTTLVVIAATVFFGVYLWGCDLLFFNLIDFLFKRFGAA